MSFPGKRPSSYPRNLTIRVKRVFLGGNGGDNSGGGGSYCVHPKARITVDWIGPGKCTLEKLHDKE